MTTHDREGKLPSCCSFHGFEEGGCREGRDCTAGRRPRTARRKPRNWTAFGLKCGAIATVLYILAALCPVSPIH